LLSFVFDFAFAAAMGTVYAVLRARARTAPLGRYA
jgi:hypothetical protein